jgi:hypothetical protein
VFSQETRRRTDCGISCLDRCRWEPARSFKHADVVTVTDSGVQYCMTASRHKRNYPRVFEETPKSTMQVKDHNNTMQNTIKSFHIILQLVLISRNKFYLLSINIVVQYSCIFGVAPSLKIWLSSIQIRRGVNHALRSHHSVIYGQ